MKLFQKKWIAAVVLAGSLAIMFESCATKRDCRGAKKVRHPNGFYM